MPQLAAEGLDARRLPCWPRGSSAADAAIEAVTIKRSIIWPACASVPRAGVRAAGFFILPTEIGLRILGRAITRLGDEGPVELAKLEALKARSIVPKSGQLALSAQLGRRIGDARQRQNRSRAAPARGGARPNKAAGILNHAAQGQAKPKQAQAKRRKAC